MGEAETQRALERILYVWAIRHPASGYVQGSNDLVTPFFEVCLSAYTDTDPETFELASLPQYVREVAEFLAQLRGVSFEQLAEQTTANFRSLFPLARVRG